MEALLGAPFDMMNLVMFDIDGTLTGTNAVDTDCFVTALCEVLQITDIDTDWTNYRYVSDQGCLEEIVQRHRGRPGTRGELTAAKKKHVQLLRERADSDGKLFRPIPGAGVMIAALSRRSGVTVALATGAWLESAQIKLRTAGLEVDGLPLASSDDSVSREEIMSIAETRAIQSAGVSSFRTKTYVGDAVWDIQAAANLGYHFVGVGAGSRAELLLAHGAKWLVPDFQPTEAFLSILERIWNTDRNGCSLTSRSYPGD